MATGVLVSLSAGMATGVLVSTTYDQLSLVGRGLNVKRAARGPRTYRHRMPFSWWTVLEFLVRPVPESVVPASARLREEAEPVETDAEEVEMEEEEDEEDDEDEGNHYRYESVC